MEASQEPTAIAATDLLNRYGFDVGAFSAEQLVGYWLRSYPPAWVRAAVVEALYQGRYKSVSVGQILAIWKRRGQPIYHFGFEFERMVCGNLSRIPTQDSLSDALPADITLAPQDSASSPEDSTAVAEAAPSNAMPSEQTGHLEPTLPEDSTPLTIKSISSKPAETTAEDRVHSGSEPTPELEFVTHPDSLARNQEGFQHSIHQFVPDPEISIFYEKLRAVAQDQQN